MSFKKIYYTLFLVFFLFNIKSQITFKKAFGIYNDGFSAYDVKQTPDNAYIIVGELRGMVALIKTALNGDTLWVKFYCPMYSLSRGSSVELSHEGGYIISGQTSATGQGLSDLLLIKTDINGNEIWSKTYGGLNYEGSCSIHRTNDGGYIVGGSTSSFGIGQNDFWLIKTDTNGDTLWTKVYGGVNNEISYSVEQTTDNGYVLVGYTNSFGEGNKDICVIKTNEIGNINWVKYYGGTGDEIGYNIKETSDRGLIITGTTNSFNNGLSVCFLTKTDSVGNLLWSKTYNPNNQPSTGYTVKQISNGYIIGGQNYKLLMIKTNLMGDMIWTRIHGNANPQNALQIEMTNDGGYITIGNSLDFGQYNKGFFMKSDSVGLTSCYYATSIPIVNPIIWTVSTSSITTSSGSQSTYFNSQHGYYLETINQCSIIQSISSNYDNYPKTTIEPNPAFESITFHFYNEKHEKLNLFIYDINGHEVFVGNDISDDNFHFDCSSIDRGLYFYQILSNNIPHSRGKFIIQ